MKTCKTEQVRVLLSHISLLHYPVVTLHSGPINHVNQRGDQQNLQEQFRINDTVDKCLDLKTCKRTAAIVFSPFPPFFLLCPDSML